MKKQKNCNGGFGRQFKEREISILTKKACARAIKDLGFKVVYFDSKKFYTHCVDGIFNVLHGREGEDEEAQTIFEYLKIPTLTSGKNSSM